MKTFFKRWFILYQLIAPDLLLISANKCVTTSRSTWSRRERPPFTLHRLSAPELSLRQLTMTWGLCLLLMRIWSWLWLSISWEMQEIQDTTKNYRWSLISLMRRTKQTSLEPIRYTTVCCIIYVNTYLVEKGAHVDSTNRLTSCYSN